MPDRTHAEYQTDTHAMLGAGAWIIRALSESTSLPIAHEMAREWLASYARYQGGARAALPWVSITHPAPATVEEGLHNV